MRCTNSRALKRTLCLALLTGVLTGCPYTPLTPGPVVKDDDVALTREHLSTADPGGTIDVSLTIDVGRDVDISAIAVVETLPSGWAYRSASNNEGLIPAIRPLEGTEGTLTFVWIQTPKFPYSFSYKVSIPLGASGSETLVGHAEYRQGSGESEYTDTLTSSIAFN